MRKSYKLLGSVALAGLVAAGASAFTASSAVDVDSAVVGAVSQAITGVHVSDVAYTTSAMPADVTSAVSFHVTEDLLDSDVITATIHGLIADNSPETRSIACGHTATGDPGDGTDLSCTFSGTALHNVTSLDIVAS
jgi:hypothetical protein